MMFKFMKFLLIFLICTINLIADESIFQDYKYNMSKQELVKRNGIFDCSKEFGDNSLCKEEEFIGIKAAYLFKLMDNKLKEVTVIVDYADDNHIKLFQAINKNFVLVALKNKKSMLDVINSYKSDYEHTAAKVSEFESIGLSNGELTYIFFDKSSINENTKKSKNLYEAMTNASINLREVDYRITSNKKNSFIFLSFTLPKLVQKDISKILNETKNIKDF